MIAGVMAICNFPLAPVLSRELAKKVDHMSLRFDKVNGDRKIWEECKKDIKEICPSTHFFESDIKWNRWNWRSELLRSLDHIRPEYVLFIDEDEEYDSNFDEDFKRFRLSEFPMMMFDYRMITDDNRQVMKYPKARHCKAYKWMPGIKYQPYHGYAIPDFPGEPKPTYHTNRYRAESRIKHYCFYTREMEESKILHK